MVRRWWIVQGIAGALTVATAFGCSSTTGKLRARFAKEHACPESQVRVTERGGTVYHASGCGEQKEYVCETFANMEKSARPRCEERGLERKAEPGGDRPKFPERSDYIPPPGGPSR